MERAILSTTPGIVSVVAAASRQQQQRGTFPGPGSAHGARLKASAWCEPRDGNRLCCSGECLSVRALVAASWLLTWDSVVMAALGETNHKLTAPVRLGDYAPAPQLVN